ncbi:MAG: HAD-IC family P-type ATPase, partial [Methanosarcinales archaeon]|nr:HAD-IC family P-type ATPase [Methanosarcinales archaeon]
MYYDSDIESVFATLDTSITGLTASEAEKRLARHGPNELIEEQKASPVKLFLSQFKSFLIIILIAASIVSAALGEIADATVIMIIVILSGVLGFIQEYRAEKSIAALKQMAAPTAIVIRDAREIVIPSKDVVPGDIVMLHAGDRIPSDSRVVEASNLMADESALTGESTHVQKNTMKIISETGRETGSDIPVAERTNMVYMGTSVSYGRGKAVVTATGMETEFGHLAGMLGHIVLDKTPLQKSLDQLGRWIGIITMIVVAGVSIMGVLSGFEVLDMFIWGIALAVAAIPEALPAVVTVSLALGVRRMVKRHSLVRKLPSVETLGDTTVICTDKTGTLTQNEMTVKKVYINGRMLDVTGVGYEPKGAYYYSDDGANDHTQNQHLTPGDESHLKKLLLTASLCNDAELIREENTWDIRGDPTEAALIVAAAKQGIQRSEINGGYPRINEIPFSSERKRMTTIHSTPDGLYAYTKGAPELILGSCTRILRTGREMEIVDGEKKEILATVHTMADSALRVMGFAYMSINENVDAGSDVIEHDMVFVGLVGMMDPPREEAKAAIETCAIAGIKTVMITGDHKLTASAVARELGLLTDAEGSSNHGIVLIGSELDDISDGEFENMVEDVSVYARVTPAHKMRVIDAFKKNGHVVAM